MKNRVGGKKGSRKRYTLKLTRKQIQSIRTCIHEWTECEAVTAGGAKYIKMYDAVSRSISKQLEKAGYFVFLPLLLAVLLTGCGEQTSCRIIPVAGTEKPGFTTSCPSGQVVTGISGSTLTCAEVSVLCPTK